MIKSNFIFIVIISVLISGFIIKTIYLNPIPISLKIPLKSIPTSINGWKSKDVNLSNKLLKKLGTNDYLYRNYFKKGKTITVYVGYYSSQKKDSLIHSPRRCAYGQGWTILKEKKLNLKTKIKNLKVTMLIMEKNLYRQIVLYWYQNRSQVIAGDYLAKLVLIKNAILNRRSNGTLVRISTSTGKDDKTNLKKMKNFIYCFYPYLNRCLNLKSPQN